MDHFKPYLSLFGALVLILQDFVVEKLTFLTKIAIFKAFGHPFRNFCGSKFFLKRLYVLQYYFEV